MSRYRKKEWDCGNLDGLGGESGLREWLEQNNFVRYGSSKGADYTCTFLNGGTALIPDDKYDCFLQLMATELEENRPWSVHENATRFSRLFFDLDIVESQFDPAKEISEKLIRDWVYTMQRAVYDFFPAATRHSSDPNKTSQIGGRAIVLSAPCAFETKQKKRRETSGGSASTPRDAQRVALAHRVGSGSKPSQSNVLLAMRHEREANEASEYTVRKTGLHIVFPNIVCDLNEMLEVRAHVVMRLAEEFAPPGDKAWRDIVDEQVYTGSAGLRLVGTQKVETCKVCRGDATRRKSCDACNGRPRSFVDRPYTPLVVHTTFGAKSSALEKMRESRTYMLQSCSIRQVNAYQTSPPFVRPSVAKPYSGPTVQYLVEKPSPDNASWTNAKRVRVRASATRQARDSKQQKTQHLERQSKSASGGRVINVFGPEHEVAKMLEEFIRQHTYAQWRQIVVSEVRHILFAANQRYRKSRTIYLINISDSSPRHCLNNGGEHRSRSIYFVATRNGVEQRCFCRCSTTENRISGVPCGDFRSNVCDFLQFALGRRIQERLFPAGDLRAHAQNTHAASAHPASSNSLLTVEHSVSTSAYPSLADVRRDTERKRRAAGLPHDDESSDDANQSKRARHSVPNLGVPERPADGSVSSAELARIDRERRMIDEEKPPFSEIGAVESSYTPDFVSATPSIARAAMSGAAHFAPDTVRQQSRHFSKKKDAQTYVTLPLREAPRSIEHYKRIVKNTHRKMSAEACNQIDRFLQQ